MEASRQNTQRGRPRGSCACAREQARTATYGAGGGRLRALRLLLASPDSQDGARPRVRLRSLSWSWPPPSARSRARSLLRQGFVSSRRGELAAWPSASCTYRRARNCASVQTTQVRSNALFVERDVEARTCSWALGLGLATGADPVPPLRARRHAYSGVMVPCMGPTV